MIAQRFRPSEVDTLVRIAGSLANSLAVAALPAPYRDLAQRAHAEIVAEATSHPSPAVSAVLGPRPGEQVWMLRIWTRHEDTTAPYSTEVGRAERSRIVPVDFAFPSTPTAEGLNRAAVLHAADDQGPTCAEVAGVLVFSYLDADDGAVKVSVHLDGADPEHLVRPDGTVPLRIVVEGTVIFDDSNSHAPHPPVLEQLLEAADPEQKAMIHRAAISAGLMWSCPGCQRTNPRASERCERPGCQTMVPFGSRTAASAPAPTLEGPR
ncbi:hypothetical protein [Streptomyces californicus]|uniref:hypothetical protein n=1 Tax=Streptomyces californicus TaxID=67351 RepID=UPI0033E209BA